MARELSIYEEKSFLTSAIEYFRSIALICDSGNNTALFRTYPRGAFVAQYGTFNQES